MQVAKRAAEATWLSRLRVAWVARDRQRGKMRDTPRARKLQELIKLLYGDIREKELPRILFLSSLLCCIIGGFWLLASLKDTCLGGGSRSMACSGTHPEALPPELYEHER